MFAPEKSWKGGMGGIKLCSAIMGREEEGARRIRELRKTREKLCQMECIYKAEGMAGAV